jgi:hypothetical protein
MHYRQHDESVLWQSQNVLNSRQLLGQHRQRDDMMFLNQRPLVFPNTVNITSFDDCTCAMCKVQHIILFNLALIHHLMGLVTEDAASMADSLVFAFELYHIVMGHMDWDQGQSIMRTQMNNDLWFCLILNNLAHIHNELHEYKYTICCLDCIREFVHQADELDPIHADYARSIEQNLIFLQLHVVAPAA